VSPSLPRPGAATAGAPARLRMAGVRVRLGKTLALAGVDLEVASGEIVALFGPNGAGKSTLLRVAAGVLRPQAGSVRWPAGGADPRAGIGYVGHRTFFSDALTAQENLVFFGRLYGMAPGAARERARALLREEGLGLFADDPVGGFSRGMQQRLAICRALMHAPELLLLDEPWSGLDPDAGGRLAERLRALRDAGGAVLLSSHDFEGALGVADRYVLLVGGRVREAGAAAPFRGRAQAFAERYREAVRARPTVSVAAAVVAPAPEPVPAGPSRGPGWGAACRAVAGRDLLLELRGRENLAAMGVFGLLVAAMFGFAFDPLGQDLRPVFAGVLLMALLFAGLLGMGRSFARELANDALAGMAAAPCPPSAVFYGKCLANAVFLLAAEAVVVPVFFVLLLVPFPAHPAAFLGALGLGSVGLVAVAGLTGAIAAHTRAGEVLQPLLALPLLSPLLIAAVRMAGGTVAGAGLAPGRAAAGPWAGLLLAFDLAFLTLPAFLFDFVLEVSA
jgi:heme exporter protein CcmB